jgi:hypothetical protein
MRSQIQGAGKIAGEGLQSQLLGKGFRSGESGFADTPLMQLQMQAGKALSDASTDVYLDEARRRMDMANLNLNRMQAGGNLELQNIMSRRAMKPSMAALDWEKEKFGQTFPWEQQQAGIGNLFNLMGLMQGSQSQVYAPYWGAISGATTA